MNNKIFDVYINRVWGVVLPLFLVCFVVVFFLYPYDLLGIILLSSINIFLGYMTIKVFLCRIMVRGDSIKVRNLFTYKEYFFVEIDLIKATKVMYRVSMDPNGIFTDPYCLYTKYTAYINNEKKFSFNSMDINSQMLLNYLESKISN